LGRLHDDRYTNSYAVLFPQLLTFCAVFLCAIVCSLFATVRNSVEEIEERFDGWIQILRLGSFLGCGEHCVG